MTPRVDIAVLHPSVPVLWWLHHRPHAADADRFLFDYLALRRIRLLVVAGLHLRILDEVTRDLGGSNLHPDMVGRLFDDVAAQMRLLVEWHAIHVMDAAPLLRAAFELAIAQGIPLYDATTAILAETMRLPLLIAEQGQRESLEEIGRERQSLSLLWLPEYLRTHEQP